MLLMLIIADTPLLCFAAITLSQLIVVIRRYASLIYAAVAIFFICHYAVAAMLTLRCFLR